MSAPSTQARRGRVFSGIQPTGLPHLGNYLGAIQSWVRLQEEYDCIYCIVDHHATTIEYDPATFPQAIFETAVSLLAAGVDPGRSLLYRSTRSSPGSCRRPRCTAIWGG